MRRCSEAVKADMRRRINPPHRQSMARISEELGIHVMNLYKWRKVWRLQGEVVPSSEREPEDGAPPTSSRWCWRAPGSTLPRSVHGFISKGGNSIQGDPHDPLPAFVNRSLSG